MGFQCGAIHQNIIKKDDNELTKVRAEELVHARLESRWGISEPKWHNEELVMAVMCAKCGFVGITIVHLDLVRSEVKLGENTGGAQFIE